MKDSIAIVGMACVYPDANSPQELWENVLSQRRAFRQMPDTRLNAQDYFDPDPAAADRTYSFRAAVIEGYVFDRARFRVFDAGFRAADHTHWLALDVASRAMADAGFPNADGLPKETTGVILGNTLTGEFSRANNLRLRWPFVRRVVGDVLKSANGVDREDLLARIEQRFKEPFPETTEDSLPGGMSNTIAGRINSHFGFQGLGYTVDGACASSLLAVTQACSALAARDLDVAFAGGVDLSLDPFELVGFAKAGALAQTEMRVYDSRANGFWPGEGCGFLVLMREADALALGRPIYALVHGWGMSADGQPSLTRPDLAGQRLALGRAYRRVGFGIETVAYFEGHGTGTQIGDEVELSALLHELRNARASVASAVGSIKANIGHAKAAAGVAGLIKAVRALHSQILPPQAACDMPCALLREPGSLLEVLREPEPWPIDRPLRAGVSAMGFGGVNVHISLGATSDDRRRTLSTQERKLAASAQDAEVFFFSAPDVGELKMAINQVAAYAGKLSLSDLGDLAAALAKKNSGEFARAAVIASTPDELRERLESLAAICDREDQPVRSVERGIFFQPSCKNRAKLGYVFPGQAAPLNLDGGAWKRRFTAIRSLFEVERHTDSDPSSTAAAQPAICAAALAGLNVLSALGIRAETALGHSLGELVALHWAGSFSGDALLNLATARGRIMERNNAAEGRMLAVFANSTRVEPLLAEHGVSVVCFNSANETVIGGPRCAIENCAKAARVAGLPVAELSVPYAFHTPLMRPAQSPLAEALAGESFTAPQTAIYSTVIGNILPRDTDIRALLVEQLCAPVRFTEAFSRATTEVDLWLEVGPGDIFGRLARSCGAADVYSIDAGGKSLKPLLNALAAIYTAGGDFHPGALFEDRFTRPFQIDWRPTFFINPCELAPVEQNAANPQPVRSSSLDPQVKPLTTDRHGDRAPWLQSRPPAVPNPGEAKNMPAIVRALISAERGVPVTEIDASHSMKAEYDLGSNGARLLAIKALKSCGLDLRTVPGFAEFKFGICTVGGLAEFLRQALESSPSTIAAASGDVGLQPWVETFEIALEEVGRSEATPWSSVSNGVPGRWEVLARHDDDRVRQLRAGSQLFPGSGVIVCFPENPTESDLHGMIKAARSALTQGQSTFIHVHHGKGGSGFVRSLKMEYPALRTAIFCAPADDAGTVKWISDEIAAFLGHGELPHTEVHRLPDARRMEPRIRHQPLNCSGPAENQPGPDDVFLVSGGAKGFTVQWVLDIAKATKARFALIGRSVPATDQQVAENLRLLAERGVVFRYYSADVLNPLTVAGVVAQAALELGPITGVIHAAAATSDTCAVSELTPEILSKTVRTKVEGLRNLLAAVPPDQLRWLYALGSIIARIGLQGEASYAVANEWLAHEVEDFQRQFPRCRCVTLELSALDGEGRATRAGREFLEALGVQFMAPAEVLLILRRTFDCPSLPSRVIVSGRFGKPPTVRFRETSLPALRFAPSPQVHYPDVEFVAETELTFSNDPYLRDHALEGENVFPAVMGLEAAAQVSEALSPGRTPPIFQDVRFQNRIVVSETAGLFSEDRSSLHIMGQRISRDEIMFGLQHVGVQGQPGVPDFTGKCRFMSPGQQSRESDLRSPTHGLMSDPQILVEDWYGHLFFHQGRFRRVRGYHSLRARHCLFELERAPDSPWFHPTAPQDLLLGDPGARDAAIHGIQACIPHRRLLPAAVDEICIMDPLALRRYVEAHELQARDGEYVYDIRMFDDEKRVVEIWRNLKLRDVGELNFGGPWPLPLLSVYLERRISECLPHLQFRFEITPRQQHGQNHLANGAIGPIAGYRTDGKPIGANGHHVSRAHALGLTAMVFDAPHELACDLELVGDNTPDVWRSMLPPTFFSLAENLASRLAEPFAVAATRAWTAWEVLHQKLGANCEEISFAHQVDNHWILLRNGRYRVVVGQIPQHLISSLEHTTKNLPAKRDLMFALAAASAP